MQFQLILKMLTNFKAEVVMVKIKKQPMMTGMATKNRFQLNRFFKVGVFSSIFLANFFAAQMVYTFLKQRNRIISVIGIILILIIFSLISSHGLIYGRKTYLNYFYYGWLRDRSEKQECYPTNLERSLEYRNFSNSQSSISWSFP